MEIKTSADYVPQKVVDLQAGDFFRVTCTSEYYLKLDDIYGKDLTAGVVNIRSGAKAYLPLDTEIQFYPRAVVLPYGAREGR